MKFKYSLVFVLCLNILFVADAQTKWKGIKPKLLTIDPAHPPCLEPTFRISGGYQVESEIIKWQAGLFISIPGDDYFCGGCLISDSFVLTAAHCIDDATVVLVKLGAVAIMHREKQQISMKSRHFIIHEEWHKKTIKNDIALIKLPHPVNFTDAIFPAKLPSRNLDYLDIDALVCGWGKRDDNGTSITGQLRCVSVPVIDNSICTNSYPYRISNTTICTSGEDGKSPCAGDSGGPLVIPQKNNTAIIIGIVSFGAKLCESGHPSVFTRVSKFVPWIQEKMKANQ
ncbi:uncharacterized protein CBL_13115 [Carabus blaptoides fortunei]